jgi:hypothetical protein
MYVFPTDSEQAASDLLAAAPKLVCGNAREAGEMAGRVCTLMRDMRLAWLPTVDRALQASAPSAWTQMAVQLLRRPRPEGNLAALVQLGASHPDPAMRHWALTQHDRRGSGLHFVLLRIDDLQALPRDAAAAIAERRLSAPGSAHALVANLPILDWLRDEGHYDHGAFLDRVHARLQTPAGTRALELASARAQHAEVREAAAALLA